MKSIIYGIVITATAKNNLIHLISSSKRFLKDGHLSLENSLVNIDGDSEIGDKSLRCHTIILKGKLNIRGISL